MDTKYSILIVDDDPKLRKTLSDILKVKGYAPIAVAQGKTALERVKAEMPAVALIDLKLEDMPGLELMGEIKKRCPGTECIVITGYASQASAIEAVNLGAYGYLQKPYDIEQLLVMIRRAIEKRHAEKALWESKELFEKAFINQRDAILLLDASIPATILDCNPSTWDVFGYTRPEMLGRTMALLHVNETRLKEFQELLYTAVKESGFFHLPEFDMKRKDGTVFPAELSVAPLKDKQGQQVGWVYVLRDITERKRAADERNRLFDMPQMLIMVAKSDATIVRVSAGWKDILGYSPAEMVSRSFLDFIHPDDMPESRFETENVAGGKAIEYFENRYRHKDGSYRTLAWAASADPETGLHYGVAQDITERKWAEEQIRRQSAMLEAINRVFQEALTCETEEELAHTCLVVAEELTGSKFGFIGQLNQAGLFDTVAISNPGWDACKMPDSEATRLIKNMEIRGIDRSTLREEESRIVNDPASHPDRVGTPEGHPPVTSFLGVPLKHAGRTIGMIGLANKESGYDLADQEAVEALSVAFVEALYRKRAEETVRESKELFEKTFISQRDAIFLLSPGIPPKILDCNPATMEVFGYTRQEMLGRTTAFLHVDETSLNKFQEHLLPAIEERGFLHLPEFHMRRKDGTVFSTEHTVMPLEDEQGKRIGWVSVVRDTTERKRAEEALRESEEKYRLHFEHVSDVIYSIDPEFRVLDVSLSVERILGYKPEELIGKPFQDLNLLAEESLETVFSDTMRVLAGEQISSSVYEFIAKDGTRKFGEVSGAPLVRDGKVVAVISVARDITERKQLEAQLRQMQKMEAIGQLAAGIAHDFNNLLTPIGGFSELLLWKAPEGSKEQEYLGQIRVAAQRATALTRQLRLFTRQEKGERRPVQLSSVVEETRDLLERSIPKEITIELRLEPELWAVEADPSQISQVLMNLCLNARDAMPEGGTLTLETRNVTLDEEEYARTVLEAQPGRYVRLSVSDTGCGMSPEVQDRLFEPFFTTKEVGKGTGLGLAVVYGVVEEHNGFINVYSQEGLGSTFRVYLPAIESAVEEGEVEVVELPTGTETILVVDDEEAVRALGQGILECCGYTVLMAENGVQALEVYQAHQGEIALVVLDVVMPQMGGQECLPRLRELNPRVKVLISTGYTAKGLAQELVAEGALEVVEKPFRLQDFATAVRAALDQS